MYCLELAANSEEIVFGQSVVSLCHWRYSCVAVLPLKLKVVSVTFFSIIVRHSTTPFAFFFVRRSRVSNGYIVQLKTSLMVLF